MKTEGLSDRRFSTITFACDHQGRMVVKTFGSAERSLSQTIRYFRDDFNIIAEAYINKQPTRAL